MKTLGTKIKYIEDVKVQGLGGKASDYNQRKLVRCLEINNVKHGYVIWCDKFDRYLIEYALPYNLRNEKFHAWLVDVKKKLRQIHGESGVGGCKCGI